MNYLSKMPLNIYLKLCFLLGCCAVLLSTCENPQPNTEQLLPPQSKGDAPPVTCKVSNVEPSAASYHPEGTITPTNEPRYKEQWYLNNDEENIHINVAPVWRDGYGTKPISVGILDGAVDTAHPDLAGSICVVEGFVPYNAEDSHGTAVAGLIAARDNGLGIIGVAPRARIYGYGVVLASDLSQTPQYITRALNSPEHKTIAVYSISIGDAGFVYQRISPSLEKAMDAVVENGFYGRGSNLVFAAGNSALWASSNVSYLNHHAVIAVNAVDANGENKRIGDSAIGYNLWISAPSPSGRMVTTDNGGGYIKDFGRTSGATPLVSGAIALLRSEYPLLTWRDVKLIVAESAVKRDYGGKAHYQPTGTMYSSATEQRYSFLIGFGLLDVAAAFALAENWTRLPDMETYIAHHNKPIPFTPITPLKEKVGNKSTLTSTLNVTGSDIQFIESVAIKMNVTNTKEVKGGWRRWNVLLTAPDETLVSLSFQRILYKNSETATITLLVNSFLGSAVVDGEWKLKIEKTHAKDTISEITDWSLIFRGH